MLYGRGAADMKTSLAAFVTAMESFIAANPQHTGSLAFLLTSDEEGDAIDGTVRVVEALKARGETLDYCIVGEPTSVETRRHHQERPARLALRRPDRQGRAGPYRLPASGQQSDPSGRAGDRRTRATPSGTRATNTSRRPPGRFPTSTPAPAPPTSFRAASRSSSTSAFPPPAPSKACRSACIEILDSHGLDYDIDWTLGASPFLTPRGPLVAAAEQRDPRNQRHRHRTVHHRRHLGRPFHRRHLPQVVEFGPLNASIHKIDECVDVAALPKLSAIYTRILEKLLRT